MNNKQRTALLEQINIFSEPYIEELLSVYGKVTDFKDVLIKIERNYSKYSDKSPQELSIEDILEIIKRIRENRSSTINFQYFKNLGLTNIDYEKYCENKTKKLKNKKSYWIDKGVSEEKAKIEISKIQKARSKKLTEKYSTEDLKVFSKRCVEYWIDKGYSNQEAKQMVSNHQRNFSLDICVDKYGLEEGTAIWEQRQIKWRETMDNKPIEEIKRINEAKGTDKYGDTLSGCYNQTVFERNKSLGDMNGVLYYVKITTDVGIFWKIGITKNNVHSRLRKIISRERVDIIFEKEMKLFEAFNAEQDLLDKYSSERTTMDLGYFRTTETFNCDVYAIR